MSKVVGAPLRGRMKERNPSAPTRTETPTKTIQEKTIQGWTIQVLDETKGKVISPEGAEMEVTYNRYTGILTIINQSSVFNHDMLDQLDQMFRNQPR